jgi:penicillin-insensitive murein endopeptidase
MRASAVLVSGILLAAFCAAAGIFPSPPQILNSGASGGLSSPVRETPDSMLSLSDEELLKRVESDPSTLGSLSIGTPSSAIIINAVALPSDPRWEIAPLADSWATSETIEYIRTAIDQVHTLFPETPPIFIGDMSDSNGGRLKLHTTHQAGRDVDFGFYYKGGKGVWYTPGTAATLDLPRNWALVRSLLLCTDVETILLDNRIQKLLYGYALSLGEDKAWLDRVFQFVKGSKEAMICHVALHRTHYHVRFFNPVAQELGRRVYPFLIQLKKINPPVFTVPHVVRSGETLGHIASRYGTSVRAVQQANGLGTTMIRAGQTYRIPLRGVSAPAMKPLVLPVRKLALRTPNALAAVSWPTMMSLYADRLSKLPMVPFLLGAAFKRI